MTANFYRSSGSQKIMQWHLYSPERRTLSFYTLHTVINNSGCRELVPDGKLIMYEGRMGIGNDKYMAKSKKLLCFLLVF